MASKEIVQRFEVADLTQGFFAQLLQKGRRAHADQAKAGCALSC
jgi:hypothetical protein